MSSNESTDPPPADISNLQQSFSKQQKKISALKELVLKSEVAHGKSTSTAQEKVRNIAQRLTQLKSKARSRQSLDAPPSPPQQRVAAKFDNAATTMQQMQEMVKYDEAPTTPSDSSTPNPKPLQSQTTESGTLSGSGSEKFQLLRKQMEENKLRMAQRASSKQHLEQLVTQLKEKFDSTQQCLEDTSELGKSMSDLSMYMQTPVARDRHKSVTDLTTQPFSLEKERIKFLENRCRLLEKQLEKEKQGNQIRETHDTQQVSNKRIQELESKVHELEQALKEAENQLDLPTNDIEIENERLRAELAKTTKRLAELEEAKDVLETTHFDLTTKINESMQQLKATQAELQVANEKLQQSETKCIELQEQITNFEEDNAKPVRVTAVVAESVADANTDEQIKTEMAKQIQELQEELRALKTENVQLNDTLNESENLEVSDVNIAEKLSSLEATIEAQREELHQKQQKLNNYEEELMEKTIELNVLNANFKVLEEKLETSSRNKPLFPSSAADEAESPALQLEIQQLKQKLDESNKAMIKLKLKCKQTEKQMEKLKKSSDLHAEILMLQTSNEKLQQKIVELEDEKGNWQLTQVEASEPSGDDLREKRQTQVETIRLLEEQKFEQIQKLDLMQQQLEELQEQLSSRDQTDRVKTEMCEIQWEEQLAEQRQQLLHLEQKLDLRTCELEQTQQEHKELQAEKEIVDKKLEHYIAENMELLDKVEKLSKSSSSAESIEIVERLTQQERAELEEYNKRLNEPCEPASVSELTQTELAPDLSESLVKLREESSELMNKIELFTTERREVLEKMEALSTENQELLQKIEELTEQKEFMETNVLLVENSKTQLEQRLQEVSKEKDQLATQVAEYSKQRMNMSQELTSLQKSSEVVAALDSSEGSTLFDKCEKSLSKLNSELEAYRRASDKGAKFNASKKLAKEAKNAYTQLSELLLKVKEASNAVETVTVVETVVAVTAPNGKALAEYEQLTAQNRDLKMRVDALLHELEELRNEQCVETADSSEMRAITESQVEYEQQCAELQSVVENLRLQLQEERLGAEEKSDELSRVKDELAELQNMSANFDRLLNDKEISYEQQIEKLTLLRKELEGKPKQVSLFMQQNVKKRTTLGPFYLL